MFRIISSAIFQLFNALTTCGPCLPNLVTITVQYTYHKPRLLCFNAIFLQDTFHSEVEYSVIIEMWGMLVWKYQCKQVTLAKRDNSQQYFTQVRQYQSLKDSVNLVFPINIIAFFSYLPLFSLLIGQEHCISHGLRLNCFLSSGISLWWIKFVTFLPSRYTWKIVKLMMSTAVFLNILKFELLLTGLL